MRLNFLHNRRFSYNLREMMESEHEGSSKLCEVLFLSLPFLHVRSIELFPKVQHSDIAKLRCVNKDIYTCMAEGILECRVLSEGCIS